MKHIRISVVFLLLLALLLPGCSTETLMDQGSKMLDKMFAGDPATPQSSAKPETASSDGTAPTPDTVSQEPTPSGLPEAEEPVPPSLPSQDPEPTVTDTSPSTTAGDVSPSHTDITFFGPGESVTSSPKGVEGIYACDYTSEDDSIASVDPSTGKVTAVGPGTTKVTMHVEYNGQYDFECIVRCSWKDDEKQSAAPAGDGEPVLPASSAEPSGAISASHSDATFFNPKEHFQLLPVGAPDDCTRTYATGDASIAKVDDKGVVTAVGPGTTTVSMTVDAGGTEYTFKCIVRCNWEQASN